MTEALGAELSVTRSWGLEPYDFRTRSPDTVSSGDRDSVPEHADEEGAHVRVLGAGLRR